MTTILDNYEWRTTNNKIPGLTFKCIVPFISSLSSICLWRNVTESYTLGVVLTIPLIVQTYRGMTETFMTYYYRNNVLKLVDKFKKLHRINVDILNYLKTRELLR